MWYALEHRIRIRESELLDADNDDWKIYHYRYFKCRDHIRRMYCMYSDALFMKPNINEHCKVLMSE